jgi:hypothetical protein
MMRWYETTNGTTKNDFQLWSNGGRSFVPLWWSVGRKNLLFARPLLCILMMMIMMRGSSILFMTKEDL